MRFDRMRVYQAAEALAGEVEELLQQAKPLAPRAADHLERSADSVLFNTAEGIGSYQPKMKISAYQIARKEANEVRAVLRKLVLKRVFTVDQTRRAYDLAGTCIAMLTKTILAVEQRVED